MNINPLAAGVKFLANNKKFEKHVSKCLASPAHMSTVVVATSVAKDVYAYALRTHNTLNNKEIPEENRKYVAAMDATTGVVTAVGQISSVVVLGKIQDKLCDTLFKNVKNVDKELFEKAAKGFKAMLPAFITLLLVKRTLVPLIATPIASGVEKLMNPSKKDMPKFDSDILYFGQKAQLKNAQQVLNENK